MKGVLLLHPQELLEDFVSTGHGELTGSSATENRTFALFYSSSVCTRIKTEALSLLLTFFNKSFVL